MSPDDTGRGNSVGDSSQSGNVYEVDNKGVCENCKTVATVVKHGHSDPNGGPFRGGDFVRCELTWPDARGES